MAWDTQRIRQCTKRSGTEQAPYRMTYARLFWLFTLGSLAGFVLEGVWCIIHYDGWESHSSLVWGPFCIIYGIGAVALYLLAGTLHRSNPVIQFIVFSLAGSFVEYFGSLAQEAMFGSTSWDYSNHALNIGGRVSLQMTLLWGVIGVAFVWLVFPLLNALFEAMHGTLWSAICVVASVAMLANLAVSAAAIVRWEQRTEGQPATNRIEQTLDRAYGDVFMTRNYPKMTFSARR